MMCTAVQTPKLGIFGSTYKIAIAFTEALTKICIHSIRRAQISYFCIQFIKGGLDRIKTHGSMNQHCPSPPGLGSKSCAHCPTWVQQPRGLPDSPPPVPYLCPEA